MLPGLTIFSAFLNLFTHDMRNFIIVFLLIQGFAYAQDPCPRWGNAREGTLAYALSVKKTGLIFLLLTKRFQLLISSNFRMTVWVTELPIR